MAVDGAALREVPPPPDAPRRREEDGAPIRYFQAPDGRVAGFVNDGRAGWTAVVPPRQPASFASGGPPGPPLMRVAPGVEAPMAAVEAPPGTPPTTSAGETIHWFAGPRGARMGFVRDGDGWRPAMGEPAAAGAPFPAPALPAAIPTATPAPAPAPSGPASPASRREVATPAWMRVPPVTRPAREEDAAPQDEPEPETPAAGGIRGWAKNWWEEAGRNTEAKRARKRGARQQRSAKQPDTKQPDTAPVAAPPSAAALPAAAARAEPDRAHESPAVRRLHNRRRWAGRLLVGVAALGVALVLLTLVTDLVNAIHPAPQQVERVVHIGGNGGLSSSEVAASSFAVQFTWAYLTYDQSNPQQHTAAIAPFLGPNVSDTWNGSGDQEVATAQAMSVARSREGAGEVDVDVAAYVASFASGGAEKLRWLYLSVPVQVNGAKLTIAALPTTIPPPKAGTPSAGGLSPTVSNEDTQLTQQLNSPMQSFFGAWASGNSTQLAYLETPNAGIQPLGSTQQTFVRLASFQVEQGSGDVRTSLALVTWGDAVTGAQFTQPYTVTWQNSGSRWLISSVRPGVD